MRYLEATNRAVGVSGSAHTKAALARGRDGVVELDVAVVQRRVEDGHVLDEDDCLLLRHGRRLERRRREPKKARAFEAFPQNVRHLGHLWSQWDAGSYAAAIVQHRAAKRTFRSVMGDEWIVPIAILHRRRLTTSDCKLQVLPILPCLQVQRCRRAIANLR